MRPLERALLVLSALVLAGAAAGHVIVSGQTQARRLVLDCMVELGWETADEEADLRAQTEQSRAWCERFVSTDRDPS